MPGSGVARGWCGNNSKQRLCSKFVGNCFQYAGGAHLDAFWIIEHPSWIATALYSTDAFAGMA
jgi:hypothetical protein